MSCSLQHCWLKSTMLAQFHHVHPPLSGAHSQPQRAFQRLQEKQHWCVLIGFRWRSAKREHKQPINQNKKNHVCSSEKLELLSYLHREWWEAAVFTRFLGSVIVPEVPKLGQCCEILQKLKPILTGCRAAFQKRSRAVPLRPAAKGNGAEEWTDSPGSSSDAQDSPFLPFKSHMLSLPCDHSPLSNALPSTPPSTHTNGSAYDAAFNKWRKRTFAVFALHALSDCM